MYQHFMAEPLKQLTPLHVITSEFSVNVFRHDKQTSQVSPHVLSSLNRRNIVAIEWLVRFLEQAALG